MGETKFKQRPIARFRRQWVNNYYGSCDGEGGKLLTQSAEEDKKWGFVNIKHLETFVAISDQRSS